MQAHRTPPVEWTVNGVAPSHKTAFIDVRCRTQSEVDNLPCENIAEAQSLRPILAAELRESGLFESFTFNSSRGTNADYKISLMRTSVEEGSIIACCISAATLTVIPFTYSDAITLSVRVEGRNGEVVKEYKYQDSLRTWIQLFLLPVSFVKYPPREAASLQRNMIRAWIQEVGKDGILMGHQAALTPPTGIR